MLIAYTKTTNTHVLERSDTPDDPYLEPALVRYFPVELRERFAAEIRGHRLRREIVATQIANQMVNLSGISFDHRMTEDTGAGVVDVTRAWVAARDIFDFVATVGGDRAARPQTSSSTCSSSCSSSCAGWSSAARCGCCATVARRSTSPPRSPSSARRWPSWSASIDAAVVGHRREQLFALEASRLAADVPEPLAQRSTLWPLLHTGFDVIELAGRTGDVGAGRRRPRTGRCSTCSTSAGCGTRSAPCRAPTAGRPRPARRCATTCSSPSPI